MKNKYIVVIFLALIVSLLSGQIKSSAATLEEAELLFLGENYPAVIEECEKFLSSSSRSRFKDEAYYLMGVAFLKEKMFDEARKNFEIVISNYPKSDVVDDAYLNLADAYLLEGDIDKALSLYEEILSKYEKSPVSSFALFGLGRCYQSKGRWEEARSYFQKVIKDYPLSFEAELASDILKDEFYFTVQVGSFINEKNANNLCYELKEKGYDAYISEIQEPANFVNNKHYRVRVGKFGTRMEAENVKEQLETKGYPTRIFP